MYYTYNDRIKTNIKSYSFLGLCTTTALKAEMYNNHVNYKNKSVLPFFTKTNSGDEGDETMKATELKIKDPKVKAKIFRLFEEMSKCDRCSQNKKVMKMVNFI